MYVKYDGGFQYLVDGESLIQEETARVRIRWKEAFDRLMRYGLLQDVDGNGEVYHLTSKGYEAAEQIREQRGEEESDAFAELEQMMPELLNEMRDDIGNNPLIREIIVLDTKGNIYNGDGVFVYYRAVHPDLDSKLQILGNHGLVHEITYNNVDRSRLTEEFVKYLRRNNIKQSDAGRACPATTPEKKE